MTPSSSRLAHPSGEAEAPRAIPARGSAGAALNLHVRLSLPGIGARDHRVLRISRHLPHLGARPSTLARCIEGVPRCWEIIPSVRRNAPRAGA
jgi:hypothetical protein